MLQKGKELEQRTSETESRGGAAAPAAAALKQDCRTCWITAYTWTPKTASKGTATILVFPGAHWASSCPACTYWLNRSHPQVLSPVTVKEDIQEVRSNLYSTFNSMACKDSLCCIISPLSHLMWLTQHFSCVGTWSSGSLLSAIFLIYAYTDPVHRS